MTNIIAVVNNYLAELFWYQLIRPYLCRPLLKKEQVLRKNHHSFSQFIFQKVKEKFG
jgi:hypothetical protein